MANMLKDAMDWMREEQVTHASETVVYRRGEATTSIRVSIGNSDKLVDQSEGLIITYSDRDYIIKKSELPYAEPELGDRVIQTIDGVEYQFEIIQPNNNDNAWRWSDHFQTAYRIHTKLMRS